MNSSFSTTTIIYFGCCYRFFVSETQFTENTSGLYICCAVFLSVQEFLIPVRFITGQKCAFTALLEKAVADTGLALWHKKSKILFVSSFFEIQIMVCIVSNLSFKLYSNAQDKKLIHKSNEGIFPWGLCSSCGRTEEENVLIFNFWSHSVLLLTLSLTDLCYAKSYWLLLFFVGIKKCCNGFLLPCHLSSLASFPPPEIHPFPICQNQ